MPRLTNYTTPLPKSQWYAGTQNVKTPEQWYLLVRHLRKMLSITVAVSTGLSILGFALGEGWEVIGIFFGLYTLAMFPWLILVSRMWHHWFADAYWIEDPTPSTHAVTKTYVERTAIAQQDFDRRTNGGRY